MPKTSEGLHDAESLLALANRLDGFVTGFRGLAQRFQDESAPALITLKEDQRKRAIEFLNGFAHEVTRALDNYLEETKKYSAKARTGKTAKDAKK